MALTAAQQTDIRRYMGYWVVGTTQPIDDDHDVVYGQFGMYIMSLHKRLNSFTPEEEAVIVNTYLTNLATLETAILGTSANLDTDQAAVWKHNKDEQADRERLFDSWRRRMCNFIGFPPGPGLGGAATISLRRA